MALELGKHCSFGFKIQSAQGSYLAPDVWVPDAGESIRFRPNYVVVDYADMQDWESKYWSAGQWAEGNIVLPLIPGTTSNILSWIQDRDADNQGKWASCLIDNEHTVKKLTDTKIRTATFTVGPAEEYARFSLDVVALLLESGSAGSPDFPTAAPYIYKEASVQPGTGGGAYTADPSIRRVTVAIDCKGEEPADGMTLRDSYAPLYLYNTSGIRVTGTVERRFINSAVYADYLAGTEAQLKVVLTRGSDVVTLTMPRIIWEDDDVSSPGSTDAVITETVSFRALGSADGATAPLTMT